MRGNKQPDWLCRECQNKNFGWREVCNRCQVNLCCVCCLELGLVILSMIAVLSVALGYIELCQPVPCALLLLLCMLSWSDVNCSSLYDQS